MDAPILTYPHPTAPEPGVPVEVAPGLLWLRFPLPMALNHVNLWLLQDEADGWTLVDTGIGNAASREIWEGLLVGPLKGRPIRRVLVTHMHPDHIGLAGWLCERFGAPLAMTLSEYASARATWSDDRPEVAAAHAAFYRAAGLPPEAAEAVESRGNVYRRGVSPLPVAARRIRDGDLLPIGGTGWLVIVGEGHSSEMACLYDAGRGILISADQVLPKISPNVSVWPSEPEADPLSDFLRSLAVLRQLPAETLVLPSHGLPFFGLGERIDWLKAHHAERLALTREVCRRPATVADLMAALFRRELDRQQLMFAVGEATAHLNHLVASGALARETGADGVWKYRQA
ncbi:MBL fold metallo-hydrolase [Inquilinus limosus]|uniref:MBL fold metallo-hydrolase n=1 Tax=Inquilinus limosus TaxID=171674 RepID=UPI003F139C9C